MSARAVVVIVAIVLLGILLWLYKVKKNQRARLLRSRRAPASSRNPAAFGTDGQSSPWPGTMPDADSGQRRVPPRYSPKIPTSSSAYHPSLYNDEALPNHGFATDDTATTSVYSGPPEPIRPALPARPALAHITPQARVPAYRNYPAASNASSLPADVEVPEAHSSTPPPEPEAPPPYSI